jgi:hypothetical protein
MNSDYLNGSGGQTGFSDNVIRIKLNNNPVANMPITMEIPMKALQPIKSILCTHIFFNLCGKSPKPLRGKTHPLNCIVTR